MKIKFIRPTSEFEDVVPHAEGEVLEVSEASAQRWLRRGAAAICEAAGTKPAAKETKTSTKKKEA